MAEALARARHTVYILERHPKPGQETTSRNSEVVHAGLYYPPGSLKAQLCVQGRELLADFCQRHAVDVRWTGKLIVATCAEEEPELQTIADRAVANGARALHLLTAAQVRRRAPQVRATQALWSAGTGIVDAHGLVTKLRGMAEKAGAAMLLRHAAVGAERSTAGDWHLQVAQPDGSLELLTVDVVVNAAGLWADAVARWVCDDADLPRHTLVKGNYFDIAGPAPADTLVYPVPAKHLVGLGTHLTLDLAGRARLGPDIEPAQHRDDYKVDGQRAQTFWQAAVRFLPGLQLAQLHPGYAGIRPKLATAGFADFYIAHEVQRGLPGWINLLGIESPGLTASLAIGQMVAAQIP